MRKCSLAFAALLLAALAAPAHAAPVTFTLGSIGASATNIPLFDYDYPTPLPSFSLDSDPLTAMPSFWQGDIFQISRDEQFSADQTGTLQLGFTFASPTMPDGGLAASLFANNKPGADHVTITWASPLLIPFGDHGLLSVAMLDTDFPVNDPRGGSAWVQGRFTLLDEPILPTDTPTPVPEPASMLLVGAGLLALCVVARGRFRK